MAKILTIRRRSRAETWFASFAKELETTLRRSKAFGRNCEVLANLKIGHAKGWPEGVGFYVDVARVADGAMISVWLDRYLDAGASPNLGVWYSGKARQARALASKFGHHREYGWSQRDDNGLLRKKHAQEQLRMLDQWFLDTWGRTENYFGRYVLPSPQVGSASAAIGATVNAARQLILAATAELSDNDPETTTTNNDEAARARGVISRLLRPEQARFRARVINACRGRCVISGCDQLVALEAAHIKAVSDLGNDSVGNGLLLRADLHRMFDAGLLTIHIEGDESFVEVAEQLVGTSYGEWSGVSIAVPLNTTQRANLKIRNQRWSDRGLPTRVRGSSPAAD